MEEEPLEDSNSRTPLIILAAASLVLVVVGIVSFTKFVAAQKDPGNQAVVEPSNAPITPEQRIELERQKVLQMIYSDGGVTPTPSDSDNSTETADPAKKNKVRGYVTDFSEEWNFVTINIGSNHNVKKGDQFYVAREEVLRGIVKVDQVYPDQSIAVFVTENDFSEFLAPKKGDEIRELE